MSKLGDYVHGRSGDKGADVTIGIHPYNQDDFEWLKQEVTAERVKSHLGQLVDGAVKRTVLTELPALVFMCEEALSGGGLGNLHTDAQGKTYFQALAKMEVEGPT